MLVGIQLGRGERSVVEVFPRLLIVFFSLLLFSGCAASGGGSWPVQTYDYGCYRGIPNEPVCLVVAEVYNGFNSRGEFQVCRQDMSNFANALDTYYNCSERELKTIFDGLVKSVPATYNCYVEFFRERKEGDLGSVSFDGLLEILDKEKKVGV